MTIHITPEMIAAWRTLQAYGAKIPRYVNPTAEEREVADAINVLDNSDWMVPIEEAGAVEETDAPRVLAVIEEDGSRFRARGADDKIWATAATYDEVAKHLTERPEFFLIVTHEELRIAALHPAEWGDTTRADMARHQAHG